MDAAVAIDAPKAIDAPESIDAPSCTPACNGDHLTKCSPSGSATVVTCDLGCNGSGGANQDTPECNILTPSNIPPATAICDSQVGSDLNLVNTTMNIDTGSAAQCTMTVTQSSGPKLCVVVYDNINVAGAATIRAIGSNALALVATQQMTIDGKIDASSDFDTANQAFISGPGAPFTPGNGGAGGGGGGGAVNGAPGGGGGGAGGVVTGTESLSPIIAGSSGGESSAPRNGGPLAAVTLGGVGGGALELSSCHAATFGPSAIVDVSGAGGNGGLRNQIGSLSNPPTGGGGGGGGGSILIEGSEVTISGNVASNGGGGGGGGDGSGSATNGVAGDNGADGTPGTTPASGGFGAASGLSGNGGAGDVVGASPVAGTLAGC